MKQWKRGMEKWGHYLLALLCAGVILLSAAWTRDQKALEKTDQSALADQSQKMAQAEKENAEGQEAPLPCRPAAGALLLSYSESPVFDPEKRVWQTHPFVDFSLAPGDSVYAMLAGEVIACGKEILIGHGGSLVSRYQGPFTVSVRAGKRVRAGETIGVCGGESGRLRVSLLDDGQYRAFGEDWE